MLYRNSREIEIIGVPSDLGTSIRGSNMGPACLRIADLKKKIESLGYKVLDYGDVIVPIRESLPPAIACEHYVEEIAEVCWQLVHITSQSMQKNRVPVILGGDHSLAIGSINGINSFFAKQKKKLGVIWIDAHADLNTSEISETGNIHGMPLASLIGRGDKRLISEEYRYPGPENIALVGIRVLDPAEKEICRISGIKYFTMRDVDDCGLASIMGEAIAVATKDTEAIHVSFDLDAIDPTYAPGVSTPVMGGLTYREAHLILEMLHETGKICSLDLVELNPIRDTANKTALLAAELIESVLGKTIL